MRKLAGLIVAGALVASAACASPAQKPAATPAAAQTSVRLEKATFAGGCFWCEETAFEGLPGVKSVISGYTGGFKVDPSYEEVSAGKTGHAESVQITFDPKAISYAQLLDIFWHNVDPTQSNGQFCDHGTQYRSAVFYQDATQKRLAEESKRALESGPRKFKGAFVTEITAASRFWPAEEYHQDYYRKNPDSYQSYRNGCGRDRRLTQLWGQPGRQGHAAP
ncbi:MAG TPA: peptide-methionine (S)-S-oxide reductase MsrA [Candidatus Eisenbacteria bacterium]|nr:peptide-methionine (S)-S-oxide reductase MsrA [Candidatus Eisenbacteria bacterium]